MPIYEYRCKACNHDMEALQKMSDAPLTDCPECGAPELRRLVSAPSFRLKGGGWYETDFKSEKERKRNIADGGEQKPAEAKDKKPDKADTASPKETAAEKKPEKKESSAVA